MKLIDFDVTVLYSRLLEQLIDDAAEGIPSYGSLVNKKVKEKLYWYHQYRFLGKQLQKSIGADKPAEEWKAALEEREKLCAILMAGDMVSFPPKSQITNVLGLLISASVFDTGAVLIGSHAFGAICNMLGIRVDTQLTTTQDIDFGIDRNIQMAGVDLSFEKTLLDAGMLAIPGLDLPPTSTSFKSRDRKVKVDFLTPAKSKASTGKPVRLRQHGVHADQLKYLDYLIEAPVQAALITKLGMLVTVPQPARFAFHKLIVATQRDVARDAKRKKDIAQASLLLNYLVKQRPHDIESAWNALIRKGWEKEINRGFSMADPSLLFSLQDYLIK